MGERTIVRIYVDGKGILGYQVMTVDATENQALGTIGLLEKVKQIILDTIGSDDMEDEDIDSVRKLLDKEGE